MYLSHGTATTMSHDQASERSRSTNLYYYDGKPSVIARLMGIDAIPVPLKLKAAEEETTNLKSSPTAVFSPPFNKQAKCSLLSYSYSSRTGDSRRCLKMRRSRSRQRRHPQEDLLQKMKEDFQSWQASKAPTLELGDTTNKHIQIIAQEILRKEKMARFGYQRKNSGNQSTSDEKAARIVLLKPIYPDIIDASREQELPKVDNMEEFLQAVKERLHKQLNVSELRTMTWGTEPIKHDVPTTTMDLSKRLSRSEAFRSHRKPNNHAIITGGINSRSILLVHRPKNVVTPPTETVSPKKDDEESFPSTTTSDCLIENKNNAELVRSFSAPESGIFPRLLLHESNGSRNHDASDIASESAAMTIRSITSFSFRETVSSLRHRFSFRGKQLFGRKKKPSFQELYPQLPISRSPPLPSESFRQHNFPQANFTELPPSPVSPLEIVGHSSRHFFSDSNCSLPELSPNCPSEFEPPASELSFRTDITVETACNLDKAYIRQVLIAAGLYDDGSLDNKVNARVDSMARPICDYVFDEVEDFYYYRDKNADHDLDLYNSSGGNATDHRMLFDLANEALQILVHGAKSGSSLGQWVIDSTGASQGRKLVDDVWKQVQAMMDPQMQEMQTIDSMVAFEVRKYVWAEVLYEDVYVVGRKIERAIFDELLEDLLLEVFNS